MRSALKLAFTVAFACALVGQAAHAANRPTVDKDTVVMAVGKDFDSLDAQVVTTGSSARFAWQLFDTLYTFDMKGNLIPSLANSYRISDDQLQYTFALKPGIKFHNGDVLTAADVKFSIDRILDPATKSTRRPSLAPVIAGVDTPDDHTVVFRLKQPDGAFMNKLAGFVFIVPKKYVESIKPEIFGQKPIGTGPFKFAEMAIGQHLILDRFDDYFGAKPKIKRLIYKYVAEPSSRVNAVLTGEADLSELIPAADVQRLQKTPGIDVLPTPIGSPLGVKFYCDDPNSPLSKRDARLALNYAIDPKAVIKVIAHGLSEPVATYISKYYPYGVDPKLEPLGYDPAKAKELLRKAGYPNGFELVLNGGTDMPRELYEVIAAFWTAIGVKTKLNVTDYVAWIRAHNAHKSGPATVMQFSNAMYDPIWVYSGMAQSGGAWTDCTTPEIDALIEKSSRAVGAEARDKIFREVGLRIRDEAFTVPIMELYINFAKNADLSFEPQVGISWYNLRTLEWKK